MVQRVRKRAVPRRTAVARASEAPRRRLRADAPGVRAVRLRADQFPAGHAATTPRAGFTKVRPGASRLLLRHVRLRGVSNRRHDVDCQDVSVRGRLDHGCGDLCNVVGMVTVQGLQLRRRVVAMPAGNAARELRSIGCRFLIRCRCGELGQANSTLDPAISIRTSAREPVRS